MKSYYSAALLADTLSLGSHWIYNQSKVARLFPEGVFELSDPKSNYHPNRKAGDHTHYGDQTVLLDQALADGSFSEETWKSVWLKGIANYDGYIDSAIEATRASSGETPSKSYDIAGASRLAPLLDIDLNLDESIYAARAQTAFTHGDPIVADAAEFFIRSVFSIRSGVTMLESFQLAASEGSYSTLDPSDALAKVQAVTQDDVFKVAADFGLTCYTSEAFLVILYLALRDGADYHTAISDNALCGGDTSARAMLLAVLFVARDGAVESELYSQMQSLGAATSYQSGSNPVSIPGSLGMLSGVLEMPEGEVHSVAIFAHCFTCGKDFLPEARITQELSKRQIATLRIDFSGLGKSEGSFSDTSFITNLGDLTTSAEWLAQQGLVVELLIGHSLGGAAVLAAAKHIETVKAVATIGAPHDPGHVTHLFEEYLEQIEQDGEAEVSLAGRKFMIGKRFLEDLETHSQDDVLGSLHQVHKLIMHSPEDATVPLENAGKIYSALKHPKSFISLPGADHLLTSQTDSQYVADLIKVWSARVLG